MSEQHRQHSTGRRLPRKRLTGWRAELTPLGQLTIGLAVGWFALDLLRFAWNIFFN